MVGAAPAVFGVILISHWPGLRAGRSIPAASTAIVVHARTAAEAASMVHDIFMIATSKV